MRDIDASDAPLHGEQERSQFHGYNDHHCYLSLYVFCRQAMRAFQLLLKRLRPAWPDMKIIVRGDAVSRKASALKRKHLATNRDKGTDYPHFTYLKKSALTGHSQCKDPKRPARQRNQTTHEIFGLMRRDCSFRRGALIACRPAKLFAPAPLKIAVLLTNSIAECPVNPCEKNDDDAES